MVGENTDREREDWLARELRDSTLPDQRLARRLRQIMAHLAAAPGQPVPAACQDWAATKAAYRFFDNDRVTEQGVLAGYFAATRDRFATTVGPVLVLQDTTEFVYKRVKPEKIGFTKAINSGHVSWRIFWITIASRASPAAPPETALTPAEITILDRIIPPSSKPEQQLYTLAAYANRLARLGGYLNRSHDPPSGNLVMWRGISRLDDIALGFRIAITVMGN